MNPSSVITIIAVLVSLNVWQGLVVWWKNNTIEDLRSEKIADDISIVTLKGAIKERNEKILMNKADYEKKLLEYKPVTIKEIEKVYIPTYIDRNITIEECHDVHTLLGEVRRIGI